jgi:hypothetical protein
MKGPFFSKALIPGTALSALVLAGCSTVETRISRHPELYQSLSPRHQALVSQGQIRDGMSWNVVWLAWGSPDRKIVGNIRGRPTETWVYRAFTRPIPNLSMVPIIAGGYGFGLTNHSRVHGETSPPQWPRLRTLWQSILRSVLLFLHTTKHPFSVQGSHFRRGGRVVSFHYMVPPYY